MQLVHPAVGDDALDLVRVGDVRERIAVDQHEVGKLVVYLQPAAKYKRPAWRPSLGQKGAPASHHGVTAALCTVMTPSQLAVQAHVATSGPLPLPFPTTTACSPLRWLRPRRHPEQQHLPQRPDVICQSSGHGGRPQLPALGRARAVRRLRREQRLAYAGVR